MSKKLNTEVEQLIDIVREYPVVYSKLGVISGTVNNNEKNLAWAKIAERLNESDPNKLKQKWRNLRDSYQKAVKFKKELEEIGQEVKYHPYRHEERMSFLLPHILAETPSKKKRKNFDDYDGCKMEKIGKKEIIGYTIESQDVEYLVEDVEYSEVNDIHEEAEEEEENERHKDLILKDQSLEEGLEQQADILDSESNICYEEVENCNDIELPESEIPPKHQMNDVDLWLTSVKDSMLKLSKINRAKAKRDINTILSNYEIQQYEEEARNDQ